MSDEHLYRELVEREREDDVRYGQNRARDEIRKFTPKPVDHNRAMHLYETEIKPVFDRRRRAMSSVAYRLFLKATGQWKGMEAKDVELVNPTKGLVTTGPSVDEMLEKIKKDPKAYRHLQRNAPPVHAVNAARKTPAEIAEMNQKQESRDD